MTPADSQSFEHKKGEWQCYSAVPPQRTQWVLQELDTVQIMMASELGQEEGIEKSVVKRGKTTKMAETF